jgi:putative membrane protein
MNRKFDLLIWVLFAAVVYLISAEAVQPWLHLPGLGNIGFTLVFVLFAVLHCARCEGWKRTGLFFAVAAVVSYLLEETGVRTGLVYGPYHYSDMLGPKLGHVPVLIPLAWFMMIYPSWVTARALLRGVRTESAAGIAGLALVAAMVMTAWDTVMDPGMAAAGNWVWERGLFWRAAEELFWVAVDDVPGVLRGRIDLAGEARCGWSDGGDCGAAGNCIYGTRFSICDCGAD